MGIVTGWVVLAAFVLLLGYLFPWQWYRDAQVKTVSVHEPQYDGDRLLTVSLGSCNSNWHSATAIYDPTSVVLTVKVTGDIHANDCADGAPLRLPEPLRGRDLIDGKTGRTLEVEPIESPLPDGGPIHEVELSSK